MNKAQQFLNEYQLYESAKSGSAVIPRSLYNEDGTMDERMKQLWIQKSTDMVAQRIQHQGIDADTWSAGGSLTGSLLAGFGIGSGAKAKGGGGGVDGTIGGDGSTSLRYTTADQKTYNLVREKFERMADKASPMGRQEGSHFLAQETQKYISEVDKNLADTSHGATKPFVVINNAAKRVAESIAQPYLPEPGSSGMSIPVIPGW